MLSQLLIFMAKNSTMRRGTIYVMLLYAVLSAGCSGGTEPEGAAEDSLERKAQKADPASLRQAYQNYQEAREDPMPTHQIEEAGKLYPVDEAPLDTAFFVFREELIDAVEEKNIFAVMEAVADDIKVGSGGENGIAAFAGAWQLESEEKTQQSPLWKVLAEMLRRGGAFHKDRRRFVAPYVYATWPEEYDAFTHAAVNGAGVRLRSEPSLRSRILTMVSYDIVEFLGEEDKTETIDGKTYPWIHLKTPDGTEGYLWGKFIDRPTGYRAGFEKRDDVWKMVFLLEDKGSS